MLQRFRLSNVNATIAVGAVAASVAVVIVVRTVLKNASSASDPNIVALCKAAQADPDLVVASSGAAFTNAATVTQIALTTRTEPVLVACEAEVCMRLAPQAATHGSTTRPDAPTHRARGTCCFPV